MSVARFTHLRRPKLLRSEDSLVPFSEYLFLLPIALALLLGVMSPGPSFLVVAHTAVTSSRPRAVLVALGLGVGAGVLAMLAAFGVYLLIESDPVLYRSLTAFGGLYLLYLAWIIWQAAPLNSSEDSAGIGEGESEKNEEKRAGDALKAFVLGLVTQLSNPKTIIVIAGIFAALLPENSPPYTFLWLFLMAWLIDTGWYSLLAIGLSTLRVQAGYARFQKPICRLAAVVMGLLSLKLLLVP